MLKSFLLFALFSSQAASAKVIHALDYKLSPAYFDGLVSSLEMAARRTDMRRQFSAPLKDGELLTTSYLSCPAGAPQADGYGCSLVLMPRKNFSDGEMMVALMKIVNLPYLKAQVSEFKAKLQAADPAQPLASVEIENFFTNTDVSGDGGTSYLCQPANDKKSWDCRFAVRE